MLNLVPFAGCGRIMCERNGKLFFIGQILELFLPEPISDAIGPASIGGDEQFTLFGIERLACLLPPSSNAFDRTFRRVVIDAHIHEALVMDQIVDPIGKRFAIGK